MPRFHAALSALSALSATLLLVSCGGTSGSPTSGGAGDAATATNAPPAGGGPTSPAPIESLGDPAGDAADLFAFAAGAVTGGTVDGADFVGRDVAIWFWAPF